MRIGSILGFALVAATAMTASGEALARHKKPHHHRVYAPTISRDYDGTPIIMQGLPERRISAPAKGERRHASRPVRIPRGSSTYIPPVNPSPYAASSSPPAALTQPPPVQPYVPPPTNSFSDRVTNAIHDYPLQRGIGNNPNDLQSFIRQRANQ